MKSTQSPDPFDPNGFFATASVTERAPGDSGRTYKTKTGKERMLPIKPKGALARNTKQTLKLIVDHGVEPKEAYSLVNGRAPGKQTLTGIVQKAQEYSLQTDEMQRLASRVVKNTLKGKPMVCERTTIDRKTGQVIDYTDNQYPSHTNMLAAASMVQDRVDPIVRQNINLNGNLTDFLPFELDKYR
jgi:hypothetical protein